MDRASNDGLTFSGVEAVEQVRLVRTVKGRGWSGAPEKLYRIQDQVEGMLEKAFEEYVRTHGGEDSRLDAKATEAFRPRVTVWSNKRGTRRSGSLRQILKSIDADEIEQLVIGNAPEDSGPFPIIRVAFDRTATMGSQTSAPVVITVAGDDRQWVGGVLDTLDAALRKDRPWWSVLRLPWPSLLLGLATTSGVTGAMLASNGSADLSVWEVVITLAMVGGLLGLLVGTILFYVPTIALLPGFEVVEIGKQSRAKSAGAILGGILSVGIAVSSLVVGIVALLQ